MIGIIGAMSVEMEKLISLTEDKEEITVGSIRFTRGKLFGTEAVLAVCGIGKVFAAMCAQTMILKYAPEAIINIMVCAHIAAKTLPMRPVTKVMPLMVSDAGDSIAACSASTSICMAPIIPIFMAYSPLG